MVTYSSKADLIAKVVEATNTVLGILEVVILDESKAEQELVKKSPYVREMLTLCID